MASMASAIGSTFVEHALPAAVRLVIDGTMAVVRPVAQVIRLKIKKAGLAGAAQKSAWT